MGGHVTLRECQNLSFSRFAEYLRDAVRSGEDAILTPYGADVLSDFIEPNSVVLRVSENLFLEHVHDILGLHSNSYAYYLVTVSGVKKLRFKAFAKFLEKELDWRYDPNAVPKDLLKKNNMLLRAYENLNHKAQYSHDGLAENYVALSKLITRLLTDEWMGVVKYPFQPKDNWTNRNSYQTVEHANWLIKQPYNGKILITHLVNEKQVLVSADQALTPYLIAILEGYSEDQIGLYKDDVTQFESVDEFIFIDSNSNLF